MRSWFWWTFITILLITIAIDVYMLFTERYVIFLIPYAMCIAVITVCVMRRKELIIK